MQQVPTLEADSRCAGSRNFITMFTSTQHCTQHQSHESSPI